MLMNVNCVMTALVPVLMPATRNGSSCTSNVSPTAMPVRRANARSTMISPGARSPLPSAIVGRVAGRPGSIPQTNAVYTVPLIVSVVISRSSGATEPTDGLSSSVSRQYRSRNDVLLIRFVVLLCATQTSIGRLSTYPFDSVFTPPYTPTRNSMSDRATPAPDTVTKKRIQSRDTIRHPSGTRRIPMKRWCDIRVAPSRSQMMARSMNGGRRRASTTGERAPLRHPIHTSDRKRHRAPAAQRREQRMAAHLRHLQQVDVAAGQSPHRGVDERTDDRRVVVFDGKVGDGGGPQRASRLRQRRDRDAGATRDTPRRSQRPAARRVAQNRGTPHVAEVVPPDHADDAVATRGHDRAPRVNLSAQASPAIILDTRRKQAAFPRAAKQRGARGEIRRRRRPGGARGDVTGARTDRKIHDFEHAGPIVLDRFQTEAPRQTFGHRVSSFDDDEPEAHVERHTFEERHDAAPGNPRPRYSGTTRRSPMYAQRPQATARPSFAVSHESVPDEPVAIVEAEVLVRVEDRTRPCEEIGLAIEPEREVGLDRTRSIDRDQIWSIGWAHWPERHRAGEVHGGHAGMSAGTIE